MDRSDLSGLSRDELIAHATALGVARARSLTAAELMDEILRRQDQAPARAARGWFGRARDLLTSVIDRGLVPSPSRGPRAPAPPAPTMTLAEIYAAQGHLERAVATLDEVLRADPEHVPAFAFRERLLAQIEKRKPTTEVPVVEAMLTAIEEPDRGAAAEESRPVPTTKRSDTPPPADGPATPDRVKVTEASSELRTDRPAAETPKAVAPPFSALDAEPTTLSATDPDPSLPAGPNVAVGPNVTITEPEVVAPPVVVDLRTKPTLMVDEIVGLAVDPTTVYLYWEVRPETLADARKEQPEGYVAIRVAAVVADDKPPTTEMRDHRVDALFGELFIDYVTPSSNVRLSVGFKHPGGYIPFAVAMDIRTPRATPSGRSTGAALRYSETQGMSFRYRPDGPTPQVRETIAGTFEGDILGTIPSEIWIAPPDGGSSRTIVSTFEERLGGSSGQSRRLQEWASRPAGQPTSRN